MKSLQDSVANLKMVGAKRLESLHELGIDTIFDLFMHFPFRYDDIQIRQISEIIDQDKVTIKGIVVTEPVVSFYGARKNRLRFKLAIEHEIITVVFFNQHYLKSRLEQGMDIAVYGKWDEKKQMLMGMKVLATKQEQEQQFASVYHTNKSIKQSVWVKLIEQAFCEYSECIQETLPVHLVQKYQFLSFEQALRQMHFPSSQHLSKEAYRRMVYQELFDYQYKLVVLKKKRYRNRVESIRYNNTVLKDYITTIPFELTQAQKRVMNEICRDLLAPFCMNRLLQGDVGSGKTVVASLAILAAMSANYQSAIMVPTEILAQQHLETLQKLFDKTSIKLALLTSSTTTKERKCILEQLASGEIDCLVGTHALIQEDVHFFNLGLVIIDEQHRFGVKQRQLLKDKASIENVLYMSATPIPRTLAMSVFGEMDVSVINELPKNRQVVKTYWVKENEMEKVLAFMKKHIHEGKQAYVIAPLIEESLDNDLKNAQEMYEQLKVWFGSSVTVALLHGRMKSQEKEAIMNEFSANRIQVLVSTTVIEVGVNVPNATIMVIQDAERFGLAQLHQLRGRVGRGEHQSYCILVANPKTEQGKLRMKIMSESHDGFYLSQKDLEMRGSGDAFGIKQSGVPDFKCADLIRDGDIVMQATQDAIEYVTILEKENEIVV
ncbi:ATP-dependent DNA helicase RecG [Granulicatella sp. 19428wC4_WM01]|nr:ATP-dependent DNA helicase RecG [Granulicatella sp. 19428wC4_WM01]MBF0779821.1 ATP-dependent DNA helicase RecG [Granulicatella sp. 19428wC4_WM01]